MGHIKKIEIEFVNICFHIGSKKVETLLTNGRSIIICIYIYIEREKERENY